MTLQIELDAETEAQLTQQARDKGIDLPTYASELLRATRTALNPPRPSPTLQEFRAFREEFSKLGPQEMPSAEQTWPRSIIYSDHD